MAEKFLITLTSLLLFLGCEKSNPLPVTDPNEQEEKNLTEFTVTLKDVSPTETKAGLSGDESLIKNLNLFLYNSDGELIANIFRDVASSDDLTFNFMALEGESCSVFAIANLGYKMESYSKYQLAEEVFSVSDFSKMFGTNGECIMSGREDFNVSKSDIITVEISRVVAKITVICNYDYLNPDVNLKINSIQICNIPRQVKYFGRNCIKNVSEAMDGDYYLEGQLGSISSAGVDFYAFENYQEANLTGATTNKQKAEMLTSHQLNTCTCIKLDYEFLNSEKVGPISYLFYLGKSMEDVIVERNNYYTITVFFNGNASSDELSVSVDNSNLKYRPVSIAITPEELLFTKLNTTAQLSATVSPAEAYNKEIVWSSSNPAVATVDNNGLVTSVSNGSCTIQAVSVENPNVYNTAAVKVEEIIVEDDHIVFDKTALLMLDIDTQEIGFTTNEHNTKTPVFTVSDGEIAEIVEQTESTIKIKALKPGVCTIKGVLGDAEAACSVTVEELTITAEREVTIYKDFYYDINYAIYPQWAAASHNLAWSITDGLTTPLFGFVNGIKGNKIVGLVSTAGNNSASGELTVCFVDAPDKKATVKVNVKDAIKMKDKITAIANVGISDTFESLDIEAPEQATVNLEFTNVDPGDYILAYRNRYGYSNGCIKISNPCGANGKYLLTATVTGDNGKINTATCTIEIYEQVFLVGISKSMDVLKSNSYSIGGARYITIRYENEIVAKYLAHPSSMFYPQGEIDNIPFSYYYDGEHYTESHTGKTEIAGPFEFCSKEPYSLAFGKGTGTGFYPPKYLEYFALEADNNGYMITDDKKYIYVTSRQFGGGFCDESVSWQEIFGYIYN